MTEQDYLFDVSLCLRGVDLDPVLVSSILKAAPSRSQRNGEERVTPTGIKYVKKIGNWILQTIARSKDLSVLVDELIRKIDGAESKLSNIKGVDEAYLDVFVAIAADEDGEMASKFQLSIENLRALEKLEIPVHFTIAVVKE